MWDIAWLRQQAVSLPLSLLVKKISDHKQTKQEFTALLKQRTEQLQTDSTLQLSFKQEMQRFLPPDISVRTVETDEFWSYLCSTVITEAQLVLNYLADEGAASNSFKM